jgi:ATP-dependent DNA helicase RecG
MDLHTPLSILEGLGPTRAAKLKKIGLETIGDLIYYFPFRYEDFSQVKPISEAQAGDVVTVKGKVELIGNRRTARQRRMLTEAIITDGEGSMKVIWFNQPYLTKTLKPGDEVYLSGEVKLDRYGVQMVSPRYEKSSLRIREGEKTPIHTARLVPMYHLTAGIMEKQMRTYLSQVVPLIESMGETIPEDIVKKYGLLSLKNALKEIHFPTNQELVDQARRRLQFDELFVIQLGVQKARQALETSQAFELKFLEKPTQDFVNSLPFKLTDDQKKSAWEIIKDLEKGRPMNRLLEGDVGSGKTVVVATAMVNVVRNGYKVVMMAPTEILAQQHYQTFQKIFTNENFRIALFTRSNKAMNGDKMTKKALLDDLKVGSFDIVIGTHAVIQEDVHLKDLGLVVIDEQHRFGVKQRKALVDKEQNMVPHFLSMTATPIPRSLALALYGDLDLSIIREMPAGRKPIVSKMVPEHKRDEAYTFIRKEIDAGRQVFVICPLIDPSDKLGVKSVTEEYERLDKDVFKDLQVGLMHGKLKSDEKETVMNAFAAGDTKVLVSTSVIEVGIDVPNASVMMIEGSDRFGLAQLHQFRGRVGRGEHQSYCFVFTDNDSAQTVKRLEYFVDSANGFELAEKDLELRGPGEVYGLRQSGVPDILIETLRDVQLIKTAQEAAQYFFEHHDLKTFPELDKKLAGQTLEIHFE